MVQETEGGGGGVGLVLLYPVYPERREDVSASSSEELQHKYCQAC